MADATAADEGTEASSANATAAAAVEKKEASSAYATAADPVDDFADADDDEGILGCSINRNRLIMIITKRSIIDLNLA